MNIGPDGHKSLSAPLRACAIAYPINSFTNLTHRG